MLERDRIPNLDSLRTISCLLVFWGHAVFSNNQLIVESSYYKAAIEIRELLSFGVPFFFTLSGFLITYLLLKEQQTSGTISLKNFYVRRVLRIWPLYFFVLLIGFVLFPIFREIILKTQYIESADWIYYVLFIGNFDQILSGHLPVGVGLGPTWSICIEEQYYLVWPLLLLAFRGEKSIYAIYAVVVFCFILCLLLNLTDKNSLTCFIYLSIGSLSGYLFFDKQDYLRSLMIFKPVILFVIIVLMILVNRFLMIGEIRIPIVFAVACFMSYIILFQSISRKFQLVRIPVLERFGKYTYGFYLYHSIAIFIVKVLYFDIIESKENIFSVTLIVPLLSFLLSVLICYFSYKYFESRFLKLKNYFY